MKEAGLDREYLSYVTLMFRDAKLEPDLITRLLAMRPTQSWRRGDQKVPNGESTHAFGGWKKSLPESQMARTLPIQLRYWVKTLRTRVESITTIANQGYECTLSCYIASNSTASIIISVKLQRSVCNLGLELQLSFFAHEAAGA